VIGIDLSGRTALVTGGGRGLGRELSLLLASAGASLVVNYLRHPDAAHETVGRIEASGGSALAVRADVSRPEDVDALLEAARERFGGVHIFVSNAALGVFRELPDFDLRGVRRTLEICAWPTLDIATRLFPYFETEGFGRVIAVSSIGSRRAGHGYAAIGMAKGAMEALMPYLAEHVGRRLENVTANAVVPSGFHDGDPGHVPYEPLAHQLRAREVETPGGRFPTMAEVAGVVLYLASDLSAAVNGQALVVDRGWSVA
jgi:enoyl-[acyl-carrier protein] reductase III